MIIQDVLDRLQKVRRTGNGWTARCPAHDDEGGAPLSERRLAWLRFLRHIERQRRLDAGEPLVHLVRDDAA